MNWQIIGLLLASLSLAACGSSDSTGSPPSGNTGNNGPYASTGTTIPEVNQLTSDAGYDGWLYYVVNKNKNGVVGDGINPADFHLMAVNPSQGGNIEASIKDIAPISNGIGFGSGYVVGVPAGNVSGNDLSNYHIDRLLFNELTKSDLQNGNEYQLKVVSTNGSLSSTPQPIITNTQKQLDVSSLQLNWNNPDSSVFTFIDSNNHNQQTHPVSGNSLTQWEEPFGSFFGSQMVAAIRDYNSHQLKGWLAVILKPATPSIPSVRLLVQYDENGKYIGEVKYSDGSSINDLKLDETVSSRGVLFTDNSLLITAKRQSDGKKQMFRFVPDGQAQQPGILKPVKNAANEDLVDGKCDLAAGTWIPQEASWVNAAYYIPFCRIDKNGFEALNMPSSTKFVKSQLVPVSNQYLTALLFDDPTIRAQLYSLDTETDQFHKLDEAEEKPFDLQAGQKWVVQLGQPFVGSENGWIYYNRIVEYGVKTSSHGYTFVDGEKHVEAVARKADGSGAPVIITDAQWIAASTNGKGMVSNQASLLDVDETTANDDRGLTPNRLYPGEVFLVKGDSVESQHIVADDHFELAAVSANHPADGIITLGELSSRTEFTNPLVDLANGNRWFETEMGAGPGQLFSSYREDNNNDRCSIYYVNTHQKNSLKELFYSKAYSCRAKVVRGF